MRTTPDLPLPPTSHHVDHVAQYDMAQTRLTTTVTLLRQTVQYLELIDYLVPTYVVGKFQPLDTVYQLGIEFIGLPHSACLHKSAHTCLMYLLYKHPIPILSQRSSAMVVTDPSGFRRQTTTDLATSMGSLTTHIYVHR